MEAIEVKDLHDLMDLIQRRTSPPTGQSDYGLSIRPSDQMRLKDQPNQTGQQGQSDSGRNKQSKIELGPGGFKITPIQLSSGPTCLQDIFLPAPLPPKK